MLAHNCWVIIRAIGIAHVFDREDTTVCRKIWRFVLTLMLPEQYICVFKQNSYQINSIKIAKMFCGRCLVNLTILHLKTYIFA